MFEEDRLTWEHGDNPEQEVFPEDYDEAQATRTLEIKTLALFETTKLQRMGFVSDILDKMEMGEVDPLLIHLQLKSASGISEMLTDKKKFPEIADRYAKCVLSAAEKYGQKKFDFHNAVIEIKEVGTKYEWDKTGDTVLAMLEQKKLSAENALKERQEFLKGVPAKGLSIIDEETGEMVTVFPPAKSSTTSIAVTLK